MNQNLPLLQLSEMLLPTHLDGSQGINRDLRNPCLISAQNDVLAINCWLAEYKHTETTYRNYRREAERLLLWAVVANNKPLSSLTREDILNYSLFLNDPQPADYWCGPKKARNGKRWTNGWKPFEGPVGERSKGTIFASLNSLFNYLVDTQYLASNPIASVRRQIKYQHSFEEHKTSALQRVFDFDQSKVIYEALNEMPELSGEDKWYKERLRFMMDLFYFACPRVDEVKIHTMSAFYKVYDPKAGKDRWWLAIRGKGNKLVRKPVNRSLLAALIRYRRFLKLSDLPELNETEPLIRSQETGKAISARRINQIMKALFERAAQKLDSTQPDKANHLRKGSPHWLRHTSLSMQDEADIKEKHRQDNAGHANIQTAKIYNHSYDRGRHEEMEKLMRPHELESRHGQEIINP